jgi:hypothetical protein
MHIRNVNGSGRVHFGAIMVIVTVVTATSLWGQRVPDPPREGGRFPDVVVTDPGGSSLPGTPWWTVFVPGIPNPGTGIGNPASGNGDYGGHGGAGTEARKCTVTCVCPYEINYSGTESSPGCSELQKFNQTLTLTRSLVGPCGTPPKDACKGEGTGADYKPDSWSSVTIITLYPGCGQPGIPGSPITDSSRRYEPNPPLVPSKIMDVPVGPHCNGGY